MITPDEPHKGLLDDESATTLALEQLKPWTNLLRDFANYGSNLIPRAFISSDKTLRDAVVIGTLLRQVVAMIDAIEILLCRSATHAAALQLRAMFEAAIYIEWILIGDQDKKASYYYVHNLLRLRQWAMRVQPGTSESSSFKEMMNKAGFPVDDTLGDEGKRQVHEIDRVLSQARFCAVRDEFLDWKKTNHRTPSWYAPLGIRDLRKMATSLNKEPLYVMVYGSGSEVMHASNYGQHIRIDDQRIIFYSIRHPKNFPTVVRLSSSIAIDVFIKILQEYRPGERSNFSRKYVEKWRQAYMSIPELNIEETTHAS